MGTLRQHQPQLQGMHATHLHPEPYREKGAHHKVVHTLRQDRLLPERCLRYDPITLR